MEALAKCPSALVRTAVYVTITCIFGSIFDLGVLAFTAFCPEALTKLGACRIELNRCRGGALAGQARGGPRLRTFGCEDHPTNITPRPIGIYDRRRPRQTRKTLSPTGDQRQLKDFALPPTPLS